jgi:indole-3-glycerol phosphate synthase
MHRYLEAILEKRRARVAGERLLVPEESLRAKLLPAPAPPDFAAKVLRGGFIVAEIKRASPSKGLLASDVDAAGRARAYERGGAGAVSVLCEPDFFRGSRRDVAEAAAAVRIPVLCKDFVVDPYQLLQARQDGASLVLLIARVLEGKLPRFVAGAREAGIEPLVEVHSERELEDALEAGARLLGINARDLDTFQVDLGVVRRLAPRVPAACACIAESGIRGVSDLLELHDAGARGFLVGEALMRSADPEGLLRAFTEALARAGAPGAVRPAPVSPDVCALPGPMC